MHEKFKFTKKKYSDKYFLRNKFSYNSDSVDDKVLNLLKTNSIKAKNILEIGCFNGTKLNHYSTICKSKKIYGVDISKKAIKDGKLRFRNLKLLNLSSIQIDKIKINFNLIICGFFLYKLDRELIFKQFDLIHKKLSNNGLLLIHDFDPLFKHSNKDINSKKLSIFKMSYDNFLVESGLFEVVSKLKYNWQSKDKRKFKSNNVSLTLFKKIDFKKKYPENL